MNKYERGPATQVKVQVFTKHSVHVHFRMRHVKRPRLVNMKRLFLPRQVRHEHMSGHMNGRTHGRTNDHMHRSVLHTEQQPDEF